MESFRQGYRLQTDDLNTTFYTQGLIYPPDRTFAYSPYWVRYEIGYHHPTESRVLRIGPLNRKPVEKRTGLYRANFIVGERWTPGTYQIKWKYKISDVSDEETKTEDFEITTRGVYTTAFEILFCQRNLGGRVNVLLDAVNMSGSFTVLPEYFDLSGEFTII